MSKREPGMNEAGRNEEEELMHGMEEYFGPDALPDPLNYPTSFKFYIMMYRYFRSKRDLTSC